MSNRDRESVGPDVFFAVMFLLLIFSQVGLACNVVAEFGMWHLLWVVPACVGLDLWIAHERRTL